MGQRRGWVYIMADRYRGAIYVGVTFDLPKWQDLFDTLV
jgi:hypothetical protein